MDFIDLLSNNSSRVLADKLAEAAGQTPELFSELLELSFTQPYPLCMRAAWGIQICCDKKPWLFLPHADEVVEKLAKSNLDGIKRNYLKIYAEQVDVSTLNNLGLLADIAFKWLEDRNQAIAIRVYCLDIVAKVAEIEPDLKQELAAIIEMSLVEASPGFHNRGMKVLKKLNK